jgi:hypothetical protein
MTLEEQYRRIRYPQSQEWERLLRQLVFRATISIRLMAIRRSKRPA